METITRKEAKAQGLKRYSTGKPCKRGHVAERFVSTGGCAECQRLHSHQYREDNLEEIRQYDRQRYAENRDKRLEYSRQWRAENRDKALERKRQYHTENRDKELERCRQHYADNPEKFYARNAKRRAAKLDRTLSHEEELTQFVMQEAAQQAEDMEDAFGMQFHVDHMIPMQGRKVSGLHVWYNLQVIPAHINISKKNRMRYTKPLEWLADAT